MATLYEMTGNFKKIAEMSSDDEVFQDTLDSIDWKTDFDNKVSDYLHVIDNEKSDIEQLKKEAKRLKQEADSKKNKVNRMREVLIEAMTETNTNKVKTLDHTVSRTERPKLEITDVDKLPRKFFVKQPDKLVKPELNKWYESGHENIPGTEVVIYPRLTIR